MNNRPTHVEPNDRVTFAIRYEDEHMLIVEKPTRVVSQPGVGHQHDTLLNGLMAQYPKQLKNLGVNRDFGLVHRLDRETSGLMAIALTPQAYDGLRDQFENRNVRKYYWAVCHKAPREHEGVIRKPILDEIKRTSRYTSVRTAKISNAGKPALTAYRVLCESDLAALIEARPVTGRLHQIRIHFSMIGAAVLGDSQYGPKKVKFGAPRLALHSHRITLSHPITGDEIDVRTKFPKDLRVLLKKLELTRPDIADPSVAKKNTDELPGDPVSE
jgi:23S rRNA pseudouridine1911/1915/1917 synthase